VVELMFSSALGIATSFFNWRARTGGGIAVGMRVGLALVMVFGIMNFVGFFRPYSERPQYEDHVEEFIVIFATGFVDNAMMHTIRMLHDAHNRLDDVERGAIKLALTINMTLYLLLSGIALVVARVVARQVGI